MTIEWPKLELRACPKCGGDIFKPNLDGDKECLQCGCILYKMDGQFLLPEELTARFPLEQLKSDGLHQRAVAGGLARAKQLRARLPKDGNHTKKRQHRKSWVVPLYSVYFPQKGAVIYRWA